MNGRRILFIFVMVGIAIIGVLVGMTIGSGPTAAAFLSGEVLTPESPGEDLSPPDLPAAPDEIDEVLNGQSSLRVAGSAMRPRDSDVEWAHGYPGEGCTFASSGVPARRWTTPIYLPQGSTVKNLRMYFNDTSSSNSQGFFTVYDRYGAIVEEWDVQSSGTGGPGLRGSVEFTHTIDYDLYSYVLKWWPNDTGTDMQLCGFRLFYYPPTSGGTFLPIVQNDE